MKKNMKPLALICCGLAVVLAVYFGMNAVSKKNPSKSSKEKSSQETTDEKSEQETGSSNCNLTLTFLGDINSTTEAPLSFDSNIISAVSTADFAWGQNEGTFSNEESCTVLYESGLDVLGMSNENFTNDTLLDISAEGMNYAGAGYTAGEAQTPVYLTTEDVTIAYICACCAKDADNLTVATESTPGIFSCDDKNLLLEKIAEADEVADYVVFLPHWGEKSQTEISADQTELAHECIDAGVDAIIGTHPGNVIGMEQYDNKPIIYSIGALDSANNGKSVMLSLDLSGNKDTSGGATSVDIKEASLRIIPTVSDADGIRTAESEERLAIIDSFVNSSSGDVSVADDGTVSY